MVIAVLGRLLWYFGGSILEQGERGAPLSLGVSIGAQTETGSFPLE